MKNARNIALKNALIALQVKETAIVLIAASILPVLVHTIPSFLGIPIGARFLPIFYAPFIAVIFFRPHVGIIAGILAPAVNALITGRPDMTVIGMLTVELAIFTIISNLIYSRFKTFRGIAPIAYLIAKFVSSAGLGIIPDFAAQKAGIAFFLESIMIAIPGIIALFLINYFAVKYKTDQSEGY